MIEANGNVAHHASGKGGGFLARSWGDGSVTQPLHHQSFDLHEKLAKEWGLKSYRRLPVLSVPAGSKRFPGGNFAPSWLDGEGGRVSVMGDSSDTAQVHPREFTEAAIRESGAEVKVNSKVVGVKTSDEGEVVGVELEGGEAKRGRSEATAKATYHISTLLITFWSSLHSSLAGEVVDCDACCVAMGPWAPQIERWFDTVNVPMEGIKSTSVVWPVRKGVETEGVALFCGEDPRYNTHIEVYPRPDGTIYCCGVGGSDYIGADEVSCFVGVGGQRAAQLTSRPFAAEGRRVSFRL